MSYSGKTSLITASDGNWYIDKEKCDFQKAAHEFRQLVQLSQMSAPVPMPLFTRD